MLLKSWCVLTKNLSQLDGKLLIVLLSTEASSSLCSHPPWCHKTKACQVLQPQKLLVSHPLLHLSFVFFVSPPLSMDKYKLPRALTKHDGEVTKLLCLVFHYFWELGGKEQEDKASSPAFWALAPEQLQFLMLPPDPPSLANSYGCRWFVGLSCFQESNKLCLTRSSSETSPLDHSIFQIPGNSDLSSNFSAFLLS